MKLDINLCLCPKALTKKILSFFLHLNWVACSESDGGLYRVTFQVVCPTAPGRFTPIVCFCCSQQVPSPTEG